MMIGALGARGILLVALAPFLFFASRDQWLHLTARKVPLAENVIHAFLGVILFVVIGRAFLFDWRFVVVGTVVFALCGALDEFLFHRGVPASESDIHAKEHFALFGFFAVFALLMLAQHGLLPRWR